jgi:hypothetical protein
MLQDTNVAATEVVVSEGCAKDEVVVRRCTQDLAITRCRVMSVRRCLRRGWKVVGR